MTPNKEKRTAVWQSDDTVFYVFSWVIVGGFLIAAILHHTGVFTLTRDIPFPCSFRSVTGLYCPGCGASHSLVALLDGRIVDSLVNHAFVPYVLLCALTDVTVNTIAHIRKKGWLVFRMIYVYIGLAILFGQWILKNTLLLTH